MQTFPLQYLLSHKGINVNICYAFGGIFILGILYISFRTNIFSPTIFFAASITIRTICLHLVGARSRASRFFATLLSTI